MPPAVEAQSLNYWTVREVPQHLSIRHFPRLFEVTLLFREGDLRSQAHKIKTLAEG